jgi:putative oxygen-independent coproporphyrinogen III oxidase
MSEVPIRLSPLTAKQAPQFRAPPPLTLYIHIPWCTRKCPYCDFNSHEARDGIPESAYIAALVSDLEHELPQVWGRPVETIFIGGGTPSLLQPESVDRLLSDIRARIPLRPNAEITLEANPGTVDRVKLAELKAAGINRLSMGVQSLNDDMLRRIGRIHDSAAARDAAAGIVAAGFDNWNIDLMYGLPGQSIEGALADLRAALALGAPHVSHYQLTIEPNTAFHRAPPAGIADDDTLWEMQQACSELFAAAGFEQYEVSAWSKPGHRCGHNLNYWLFGDYLGIGAGAHAKVTVVSAQSVERSSKLRGPRDYMAGEGAARIAERRQLDAADLGLEFMMNALRLNEGFPRRVFEEHAGVPLLMFEKELSRAEELGLIARDHLHIRPTAQGRRYLNELLMLFVPGADLA